MRNRSFIWLLASLLVSCTRSSQEQIPFNSDLNIQIDGQFGSSEWSQPQILELTPHNFLYLIHDEDYLYIGINNQEQVGRYVDLYLFNESMGIINLHASMQLGERELVGNWNDTIPKWNWGNQKNWMANTVEVVNEDEDLTFLESVRPYEGHEFRISKEKIQRSDLKMWIEVKDFMGQANDIIFPANSDPVKTETWFPVEMGK
ncbi:MAG: hypothetical protein RJQ09_21660 [Cyclobacteriaceae bacterium]